MKNYITLSSVLIALVACALLLPGCKDDPGPSLTGDNMVYTLGPKSNPGISGNVTFSKQSDNAVMITIQLNGTQSGGDHPAHIHADNAIDGGGIVLDLSNVEGSTGRSVTVVTKLNDGTPITYEDLLDFDGYVNVHMSSSDLGTLIAQGDIGQNALTNLSQTYPLGPVSNPAISGTVKFEQRKNGEAVATVSLSGTSAGDSHPAHIHNNSAAQGGGIVIDFNEVDGATGMSKTNIKMLNDATPINYTQLLDFNGYVNVHLSSTNLGTLIAQGDIGQNALTGTSEEYPLKAVSNPSISGMVTFAERKNGNTLVTIALEGTTEGDSHPAHIHANTAAEGGGILIDLSNVNGATGLSRTNVTKMNNDAPISYAELVDFNGYVNVHLSSGNLGTLIAQGDIGANALTGDLKEYTLNSVSDQSISGSAMFEKRKNGYTLVTIQLEGTTDGGDHPAHIHNNSAAMGGPIAIDLTNVNGTTGKSLTNVTQRNDQTGVTYDELIDYNGYINVHLSEQNLGTLIAQGNIGSNAE